MSACGKTDEKRELQSGIEAEKHVVICGVCDVTQQGWHTRLVDRALDIVDDSMTEVDRNSNRVCSDGRVIIRRLTAGERVSAANQ